MRLLSVEIAMFKFRLRIAVTLLLLFTCVGIASPVAADSSNHVGLVVQKSDGTIVTRCVEFTESEISGLDVLLRSGLEIKYAASSQGTTVCSIDGEGCPSGDCFCDFPERYWSYWLWADGTWQYSPVGASQFKVQDGDIQGWAYTENAQAPSFTPDLGSICQLQPTAVPATATSTVAPATATPIPPTATLAPTVVPTPDVWFRLDENPINAGDCTTLRWDTESAWEVYLDDAGQALDSSVKVCPTEATVYQLRVISAAGEQTYELTLGVTGVSPTMTTLPTVALTTAKTSTPAMTEIATSTPIAQQLDQPVATLTRTATVVRTSTIAATVTSIAANSSSTVPSATETQSAVPTSEASDTEVAQEPNETTGYVILSVLVIALASSFFVARRKHK